MRASTGGQLRPLGAAAGRRTDGHPGGDGLDRLRPRRPIDAGAEPGDGPRSEAPLIWLIVWKEELADRRNDYEDAYLRRLAELGFGYVIRFRGNIRVTDVGGECRPAAAWVGKGGRARKLRDVRVTAQGLQVGAMVCVHAKGMKEPWCLAASDPEATAPAQMALCTPRTSPVRRGMHEMHPHGMKEGRGSAGRSVGAGLQPMPPIHRVSIFRSSNIVAIYEESACKVYGYAVRLLSENTEHPA